MGRGSEVLPGRASEGQGGAVHADLNRPPLPVAALTRALARDGFELRVVPSTGSTNADVAAAAREGSDEGLVVVAEHQVGGRGRLDRTWVSPPRSGLTFSVLLRPAAPSGWLPLLAGLALAVAVREHAGLPPAVDVGLKWPNDLLLDGRKAAGLLAEVVPTERGSAVVIGIGLNVHARADELPHENATSLAVAGAQAPDRGILLPATLRALARAYASWQADPSALAATYRTACRTIGSRVRIVLPGDQSVEGLAEGVDDRGRLLVDGRPFGAGDVVHVR